MKSYLLADLIECVSGLDLHEILPPNIYCPPLAMQQTLVLRAAKHMRVIGL